MKTLAIWILKSRITKVKRKIENDPFSVLSTAYKHMIISYESSIGFLESEN